MKGERRHELQQNVLLAWLNDWLEAIKPYSTLITLLIVLAVVAFAGWKWWSRQSASDTAYAWNDLFEGMGSGNPTVVKQVAELRPDSDVAHWAEVVAGDMYLAQGCEELFRSKATAAQDLRKAVDQYLIVLKESRVPVLRERATFGLAKAYEALAGTRQSEGELEKAVGYYQEVASTWPNGAYAETATRRAADLKRQDIKEFYDKFAQYDPQPAYTAPSSESSPMPPASPASPGAKPSSAASDGGGPTFGFESLDEGKVPDVTGTMKKEKPEKQEEAKPAAAAPEEPPAPAKAESPAASPPAKSPATEPAEKKPASKPSP